MNILAINPFTYEKNKNDNVNFYLSFNISQNIDDGISKLVTHKKPVFLMPNPYFYFDTDFQSYSRTIKDVTKGSNIYFMDKSVHYFKDPETSKQYKLIGSLFWNDFEGLNEEFVTLSMLKSPIYKNIQANEWLENPDNLNKFIEINENLKKNNVYYKVFKEYYKIGNFHPIISYLLYKEEMNFLLNELKTPFDGEIILLSNNHPTSYSLYYEGNQINSNSDNINSLLNKTHNIEGFLTQKTNLELFLKKSNISHIIHGSAKKPLKYQYYNSAITGVGLNSSMIDINNFDVFVSNTLNFVIYENQKFVDIIRKSMIKSDEVIKSTSDFINFFKMYSFLFSLLDNDFFNILFESVNGKLNYINIMDLDISNEEIESNILSVDSLMKKMNIILKIISNNHFLLQKALNKFPSR